jgi:peptide/nickel transport system permease protein
VKYLMRRAIRAVVLLFGVSVLCFLFTEMAPGSFFDEMRLNPQISPDTIANLRARYGLAQPLLTRYGRWLTAVVQGDFGFSIAYNASVAPLLWVRARNTLLLTTTAMMLTWLIGVPLGVWSAACHGRWFDRIVETGNSLLLSIPEIVIALGLLALAVRSRIVPVGGMMSIDHEELSAWGKIQDILEHLLLPVAILVIASVAIVIRHVRAGVVEVLGAPYVRAGQGLGIGQARLLFRHVLPAAASPAISLFGLSIASLLSGSLLVEVATGWPGLGPLLLEATLARDLYLVIGGIIFSALFLIVGNFIADLLLLTFDPRIRTGGLNAE